ncbi:AbiH family protein [Gemella morbillorum]|uniref:AbiH family protein n=1 Tax=Gemella morbillorum TaxID=29391 RepID=UPI00319E0902
MEQDKNLITPNVLLVIGNGFDCQCELKSTYYDFLIEIIRNNEKNKAEDEKILSEYLDYIEYCSSKFEINNLSQIYFRNSQIEELNIWYLIFLYKKLLMEKDWNFIESQIFQEITEDNDGLNIFSKVSFGILTRYLFDNSLDSNVKLVFSNLDYNLLPNIYNVLAYNLYKKINNKKHNNIDIVYKNLISELDVWKEINEKKILDIENDDNSNEKIRINILEEKKLINCIAEVLLEELKEVECDFIMYLKNEIKTQNNYLDNAKNLAKYILKFNENVNCNIISFNYTNPWEEDVNFRDTSINVNLVKNIHGTLENNSIIFGVDDNKIDASSEGYRFTKVSRIMGMNAVGKVESVPIKSILTPSIEKVVFYGHSLSDADYGYFRMIFDEYVKKENVCFEFCYTVFEGTTEKNEIIKLREGISRLFGRYEKENYERKYILKDLNLNNRIKFREIPKLSDENKLKN